MQSAVLHQNGDEWTLAIVLDWTSDLSDRIRRQGSIANAALQFTTDTGVYAGLGRVGFGREIEPGVVSILVRGIGELRLTDSRG